jgi:hypothetical protein
MAKLLFTQPDDLEPIEFTHFDTWFDNDDEVEPVLMNQRANDILDGWEKTLGVKFERDGMDFSDWDAVNDLFSDVCNQIVEAGFSVYLGGEFIEVYSREDSKTNRYQVIKVVGYAYEVDAKSEEEAKEMVEDYGTIEAIDWYTDSIDVTKLGD